eukprot:369332-Alexandrium_andersonii.AAC.1
MRRPGNHPPRAGPIARRVADHRQRRPTKLQKPLLQLASRPRRRAAHSPDAGARSQLAAVQDDAEARIG